MTTPTDSNDFSISILKEEQARLASLKEEEVKHKEIAERIVKLYHQTRTRQDHLLERERVFSKQAGQLLNALRREEAAATKVSATIRRIRQVRKQLLGRITTPRWEIPHHYHMTCSEHILGRPQAHIMDVGEMIPGHLRLYCYARQNILLTKSLIFALGKAKEARKIASEQIKDVYRQLRSTRAECKEIEKLLIELNKKKHLLNFSSTEPVIQNVIHDVSIRRMPRNQVVAAAVKDQHQIKSRYFASLNLKVNRITEELEDVINREKTSGSIKKELDEKEEWKQLKQLLVDFEKTSTTKPKPRDFDVFEMKRINEGRTKTKPFLKQKK